MTTIIKPLRNVMRELTDAELATVSGGVDIGPTIYEAAYESTGVVGAGLIAQEMKGVTEMVLSCANNPTK
jgi:bacteriocin-like protein